ncbi:MAG: DUF255 domain-containing protein [Saprospiraceae bacterium]|nr:DUF255 domain-containing protein [Saprospiraceae bacterium]MCB0627610.1 DUF255 domain-containing protein [Saprospiraceae bacterium]MCB0676902.1 DUF255 domain-containing protein [Saprospiraceae bacterium]MCB0679587.1 DUF255 domain-containing protein [Saprospiraceae bacterium]
MRKSGSIILLGGMLLLLGSFSLDPTPVPVTSPTPAPETDIHWLTWEQATEKMKTEKRKFIVDIYTDWCGWCKRMDAATFQQPYIAKYVNEHYYAIKFNAEQKQEIQYKGKNFKFVNNGQRGYHELVAEITNGRFGYPTVVFLDENMNVIQAINGYKGPDDFEMIMTYFAQDYHKKVPWDKYQRSYQPLPHDE